jgi:hypothetical protein
MEEIVQIDLAEVLEVIGWSLDGSRGPFCQQVTCFEVESGTESR